MNEVLPQEIEFLRQIKDECEIIFDIGSRDDVDYLAVVEGKTFYMFEPNPLFYADCKTKVDKITNNTVHLYNIGIGNQTGTLDYYERYQSFFHRYFMVPDNDRAPIKLQIKKFSEFLEENKIEKIDFLKIDTEGADPDILLDSPDFIKKNVKYIQFEYGSTWIDRRDNINLDNITSVYKDDFDFYILYNPAHPISREVSYSFLVKIDSQELRDRIESWMIAGYGYEIIMINKTVLVVDQKLDPTVLLTR